MTEPDFWAQQWARWICEDCDNVLAQCTCEEEWEPDPSGSLVECFLHYYSE